MSEKPSVLFVCVKNGGKSQIAAGLMRQLTGDRATVDFAGTRPGSALNELSVSTLAEVGVDISTEVPKALTDDLVSAADRVVTLRREAHVDPVDGTPVENSATDEPSDRSIKGAQRMRLVRDDIAVRVRKLANQLDVPEHPSTLSLITSTENSEEPPTTEPY